MKNTTEFSALLPLVKGITKLEIALKMDAKNPLFKFSAPSGKTSYHNYTRNELIRICIKHEIDFVSEYHKQRNSIEWRNNYAQVIGMQPTRSERLRIYRKALVGYLQASKSKDYTGLKFGTHSGFCFHFKKSLGIEIYNSFKYMLPELFEQRPVNGIISWFPDGHLPPRIKCLKSAIVQTLKQAA